MKKTWKMTTLAALAVSAVAWAGAQAQDRSFGDGTLPDHLAVYDVDDDGTLSVEEIQAMRDARQGRHQESIAQWDTNDDSVIDVAERAAARDALRQRIIQRRMMRFHEADSDGDGCLTFVEFSAIPAVTQLAVNQAAAPARIFDRLDINNDNCISLPEFLRKLHHRRHDTWRTPEVYFAADGVEPAPDGSGGVIAAGDGCLTFEEFSTIPAMAQLATQDVATPGMIYSRLDRNDDGCLTLLEFVAPIHLGNPPAPWTPADIYDKADADGDDCLTLAEWGDFPPMVRLAESDPTGPARIYAHLNTDVDDACLTLREFIAGRQHEADPPTDSGGP